MKSLQVNDIEMYSTRSVVAERFTRTLENKIYKYMTSVSEKCKYQYLSWHS